MIDKKYYYTLNSRTPLAQRSVIVLPITILKVLDFTHIWKIIVYGKNHSSRAKSVGRILQIDTNELFYTYSMAA